MAKSMITINMNYQKMLKQAEKLEKAADLLKKAAGNHLESGLTNLSSAWRSDTANGFLSKGDSIQDKLLKEANEVSREAEALRKIAKNIYEAEKQALLLAQQRK